MIISLLLKIIAWLALWILVWFIFYLLNKKKINYIEGHRSASVFFFLVSVSIFVLFYKDLSFLIKARFQILPFLCLFLLFILNWLSYKYVGKFFPEYKKAFELDDFYFFAKFDRKYLLSKSFEILFQQIMVALLAVWLVNYGLPFSVIIFIFAVIFGFGHVPNLFFDKKGIGLFFLIFSVLSSFIFPFLILKVEWGFIYSYIIHWVFYIIAGFLFI